MRSAQLLVMQVAVAVVLVVAWQVVSTTHLFGDPKTMAFFFSTPGAVASQVWEWISGGSIWYNLWITLWEATLSFLIGTGAALVLGFWSPASRRWRRCSTPT